MTSRNELQDDLMKREKQRFQKTRSWLLLESASLAGGVLLVWSLWNHNPLLIGLGILLGLIGVYANARRNYSAFQLMDEYEQRTHLLSVATAFIFLMGVVNITGMLLIFTNINPLWFGLTLILSFLISFGIVGASLARQLKNTN